MPTKITSLTSLGATPADNDVVPIVDVSDTSQAATGTAKKLTVVYFAKTDGSATTVTGGGTISLGGYTVTVPSTGTVAMDGHTHTESDITDLGSYAENINDLGDVTITTPADNEVLAYDGVSAWINQTPAEAGLAEASHTHVEADITDLGSYLTTVAIDDVSDIVITTPADNEVLAYDSGGNWINQTPAEAGLAEASHTHVEADITDLGSYEPALGNPASDGYVLSSTAAGTRSWVANTAATAPTEFRIPLFHPTSTTGVNIATASAAWNSYEGNAFRWNSEMLPSGWSVYLSIWGKLSASVSGQCRVRLYRDGVGEVSSSLAASSNGDAGWNYAESSSFSLVDGADYYLEANETTASSSAYLGTVQLIIRAP